MTNPIPAPLAIDLSTIANGLTEDATPVASSLAALEATINALITALSGGTAGQMLTAADAADVAWGTSVASLTTAGAINSTHGSSVVGGDGTHPGFTLLESALIGLLASVAVNAGNTLLTSTVAGDVGDYRFSLNADGKLQWGPGSGARDTSVARAAPGQLAVGGSTAGKGNIVGGAVSTSKGGGSWAPDAATLFNRMSGTAVGSYTIAAPTNPPGANQSAIMVICIHNASGGAMTLSWDAAFNTVPAATVGAGSALTSMWAWNPSTSKWDLTGAQVAAD